MRSSRMLTSLRTRPNRALLQKASSLELWRKTRAKHVIQPIRSDFISRKPIARPKRTSDGLVVASQANWRKKAAPTGGQWQLQAPQRKLAGGGGGGGGELSLWVVVCGHYWFLRAWVPAHGAMTHHPMLCFFFHFQELQLVAAVCSSTLSFRSVDFVTPHGQLLTT